MKKMIVMVSTMCLTLATTVSVLAQDSTKLSVKTQKLQYLGFYVAPEFQYGQLKNSFTEWSGMSGMLLFNKTFGIGATAMVSTKHNYSPSGVSPLYLRSAYAGLKTEYIIKPNSRVHFNANLVLGGGGSMLDSVAMEHGGRGSRHNKKRGHDHDRNNDHNHDRHNSSVAHAHYYIIQPGIQAEANVFRFMKVFAGAQYRLAIKSGTTSELLPASTMQGFSTSIGVKLGIFDYKLGKNKK
jgi:hypothetical protein